MSVPGPETAQVTAEPPGPVPLRFKVPPLAIEVPVGIIATPDDALEALPLPPHPIAKLRAPSRAADQNPRTTPPNEYLEKTLPA